jgi:ABC-type dipeptide/oligopeptide/nickel transport system permease subunit
MRGSRNAVLLALAILLLAPVAIGLFRDPVEISLADALSAPSLSFPFGTDHMGRDVLARIAQGFLWDFGLSVTIVLASLALGLVLGLAGGYAAGAFDGALTIVMDLLVALPHLVLAIVLMAHFDQGPVALAAALTLPGWVKYARLARARAAVLREADFILMERVVGAGRLRILLCHMVPNVLPPLAGLAALHLGQTVLHVAALGFLGLGLQPPTPEWGGMILESRPFLYQAPWLAMVPGFFVFLFMMVFTLLADRLEARAGEGEREDVYAAA